MELNKEFVERTRQLFGEERFGRFSLALDANPIVSVRYNAAKSSMSEGCDVVSWASNACYLDERPLFTADPMFHAGCYYVQEASSMFLEQIVNRYVDAPVCALDLCAAPGGKSTHLLSLLPKGSFLVANEPVALRAQVLAENIIKWGNPYAAVTKNEPRDFASFKGLFDFILVDAPCSGEGMFRKDSYAVEQWSLSNVKQCAERQKDILADVWRALRPGGLLVYSTCTFNREENEECVEWIAKELGADVLSLDIPSSWGVTGNLTGTDTPVYRFIPGYTRGEGLFMSVLRKHGNESPQQPRMQKVTPCPAKIKNMLSAWVKEPGQFDYLLNNDTVTAVPKEYASVVTSMMSGLKVIHAALPLAQLKNDKPIPHHALAVSTMLNSEAFCNVELNREQALRYLHRESLTFPDAPLGILLLKYNGVPLGFAKNVGNRANNMYPSEWRIRKNPMEF